MDVHITKEQQVKNILADIQKMINKSNVNNYLPILEWTKNKIDLSEQERNRQLQHSNNRSIAKPRAVQRGEIYGAALGRNIGSEQNGRSRPVIIIQESSYSKESPTILVAPLTNAFDKQGKRKRELKTHVTFSHPKLDKESIIKLEHMRSISKNRLHSRMCEASDTSTIMSEIDKKLILTLGIKQD